jgi:hypothetical protein
MCMKTDLPSLRRTGSLLPMPLLMLAALWLLSGCGSMGVEPWERDLLAQPAMAPEGVPLHGDLDDHVYFSKEAATGGRGFGGGGCGCN